MFHRCSWAPEGLRAQVAQDREDAAVVGLVRGQAQLAERIGVTRQTVIAIEQGRYSPSLEMAFQIARVFGVPLDQVFQYPDEAPV